MLMRLASDAEALDIVSEPATIQRIGKLPEKMLCQPWVVEDQGYRLLAVFWFIAPGIYEAHIAMKRGDVIACRWLAYQLLKWLFAHGASCVRTNCPEGSIANLARNLGMRETSRDEQQLHFEVSPWELVQQSEVARY